MNKIVTCIIIGLLAIALIVTIVGLATNWFKGSMTPSPSPTPSFWDPACQKEIDTCGSKCNQTSREDQMLSWCAEKQSSGQCNQDSDCEKACTNNTTEQSCTQIPYCRWNNTCMVNQDMAKLSCKCAPNNASCKNNHTSMCYFGDFPLCIPGAGIECG